MGGREVGEAAEMEGSEYCSSERSAATAPTITAQPHSHTATRSPFGLADGAWLKAAAAKETPPEAGGGGGVGFASGASLPSSDGSFSPSSFSSCAPPAFFCGMLVPPSSRVLSDILKRDLGRQGRLESLPLSVAKEFSILSSAQENIYSKFSEIHILKAGDYVGPFKWSTSEIVSPCSC